MHIKRRSPVVGDPRVGWIMGSVELLNHNRQERYIAGFYDPLMKLFSEVCI
jgi:hypothetical protein